MAVAAPAMTYGQCVAKVDKSPADALASAESWAKRTKDPAADHCAAIALSALGRYAAAADRLQQLIPKSRNDDETIALYDQIGVLRLDQDRPDLALDNYAAGLAKFPKAVALLTGRARVYAAAEQWPKAIKDLTVALAAAPDDPRLLLLYATAMRRGGHPEDAKPMIDRALSTAPDNPDLLLERGNVRWDLKDDKGAVADWSRVVQLAQNGSAHDAAQRNLDAFRTLGK